METILAKLSITPNDKALYNEALTHPSASKKTNYERLEFLGDAVIELITTQYVFHKFPKYPEGKMTKLRAKIVSRPSLAKFARDLELAEEMKFSAGERGNKGLEKDTNLCNAFEALMGAIYLDLGYESAEKAFLSCAQATLDEGYLEQTGIDNPKGKLQEILQAIKPVAPNYEIISESGPDHEKNYLMEVHWLGTLLGKGHGGSKKLAESAAAMNALEQKMWHTECVLEK